MREKKLLRNELKAYITILKILSVIVIITIGIVTICRIDSVMSEQAKILKTQEDCMNQIMEIRQEIDEIEVVESLGEFTLTHYCDCLECCGQYSDGITATGTEATQGRTIAVDPNVIPLGSEVLIDGQVYIAEDVGGAIKGNRIDVYVDSHSEAIQRGVIEKEVYIWLRQ